MKRPMTFLIIEDDSIACENFKNEGITNSSKEGILLVKSYMPDCVVLDMELNFGIGSGMDFIKELNEISIESRPLVFVTTSIQTARMYQFLRESKIDFIFYKNKEDYSEKLVFDNALIMKECYTVRTKAVNLESKEDVNLKIREAITLQLDSIGIGIHLVGRKYLEEAIYFLLNPDNEKASKSPFLYTSKLYKVGVSSISRAMQTSINYAWRRTPVKDLEKYYTAKINFDTGVPTPTEFIYYYEDKIRKILNK